MAVAERQSKQSRNEIQPDGKSPLADVLSEEMKEIVASQSCTKRTAARLAITNAIRSEVLRPGDLLPSEKELTGILGVSLGTVQAALGQLKSLGAITRRRGDGSRVTDREPFGESVWHFRFISPTDGTPLIIRDEQLRVEETTNNGPWSRYFVGCKRFVRIWRHLTLRDGIKAGADMYLAYNDASALVAMDGSELMMANIRPYLEEHLGLATKGANHRIRTTELDREMAEEFELTEPGDYFEIHARAYSPVGQPVYFQRIFVPAAQCALEF